MQKVRLSNVDFDASMAPKPPPDPSRQLSRAGSRPRHSASGPHSPNLGLGRLKAESLTDGMSALTRSLMVATDRDYLLFVGVVIVAVATASTNVNSAVDYFFCSIITFYFIFF